MSKMFDLLKEGLEDAIEHVKRERLLKTDSKHKKRKKYNEYCGEKSYVALETPKRHSSCRCCSNPRKSQKGKDKFTLQERKDKENHRHDNNGLD
jgi:hypothetical protein